MLTFKEFLNEKELSMFDCEKLCGALVQSIGEVYSEIFEMKPKTLVSVFGDGIWYASGLATGTTDGSFTITRAKDSFKAKDLKNVVKLYNEMLSYMLSRKDKLFPKTVPVIEKFKYVPKLVEKVRTKAQVKKIGETYSLDDPKAVERFVQIHDDLIVQKSCIPYIENDKEFLLKMNELWNPSKYDPD